MKSKHSHMVNNRGAPAAAGTSEFKPPASAQGVISRAASDAELKSQELPSLKPERVAVTIQSVSQGNTEAASVAKGPREYTRKKKKREPDACLSKASLDAPRCLYSSLILFSSHRLLVNGPHAS